MIPAGEPDGEDEPKVEDEPAAEDDLVLGDRSVERDDWMDRLVVYGRRAREMRLHLERVGDLLADGDEGLRSDLRLVVDTLWPSWAP